MWGVEGRNNAMDDGGGGKGFVLIVEGITWFSFVS